MLSLGECRKDTQKEVAMSNTTSLARHQQKNSQLKIANIKKMSEGGKQTLNNTSQVNVNITTPTIEWGWEEQVSGYNFYKKMIKMMPNLKKIFLKKDTLKEDHFNSSVGRKAIKQKRKSVSAVSTFTTSATSFSSLDFAFVDFDYVPVISQNGLTANFKEHIIITLRRH